MRASNPVLATPTVRIAAVLAALSTSGFLVYGGGQSRYRPSCQTRTAKTRPAREDAVQAWVWSRKPVHLTAYAR